MSHLLALVTLIPTASAWTVDGPTYRYANRNDVDVAPFRYVDIRATGTPLTTVSTCDDCWESIGDLLPPGPVMLGDEVFSSADVVVEANGRFMITDLSTRMGPAVNMAPNLTPNHVYFQRFGDVAVVQFTDMPFSNSSGEVAMQVHWDTSTGGYTTFFDDFTSTRQVFPDIWADGDWHVEVAFNPNAGDTFCAGPPGLEQCPLGRGAADFVRDVVEDEPGFAGAIDDGSAKAGLRPGVIEARIAGVEEGFVGCQRELVAGTFRAGRPSRVVGAAELGDAIEGASLSELQLGSVAFEASIQGSSFRGEGSDGRELRGFFVRIAGNRRVVWYGVSADCGAL